jgi:hypothetical protein
VHKDDQEKTTFTCPFGTFSYSRMPFGLWNAPATFQRSMNAIFADYIEKIMEVFMDDISVYGTSIEKLPYPKDIKCIRSFLGHAGFYRRFIKDFSKILKPLTNLLQKYVPFSFTEGCVESFNVLKNSLISAPIIQPLIGICLLKLCVMQVIMQVRLFWANVLIKS